jgi:glutamate/tyrosine decarboxylase-like PLP-dependent enzyme
MDSNDDDSDGDLVYYALCGYANWIETENFLLSATDAAAQKKPFRALGREQMRRVLRLREMADYFLKHGDKLTFDPTRT